MKILNEAQILELYSAPTLSDEEKERLFFIDDVEQEQMLPREEPILKINYVLLLGYFKVNPTRIDIKLNAATRRDFEYIRSKFFPGVHVKPCSGLIPRDTLIRDTMA